MKIRLDSLQLQFRKTTEVINLATQVTFFHGPISSGKSSIARLIDYCLGGHLHSTLALTQEFVSATLALSIGEYQVLLEREGLQSSAVRATWSNAEGLTGAVLAPLQAGAGPVWSDEVYNLSDLLFFLAGVSPMKVRRSKREPDSPLVRLSFRDLMWYCYLDQDHLDSSFFNLEDDTRKYKSRDVMRFVVGFYTEHMSDLERELDDVVSSRIAKEEAAKQIRAFLEDLEFGSPLELDSQISKAGGELQSARDELISLRQGHQKGTSTHFVDDLRQKLRKFATQLAEESGTLQDLEERISQQQQLRAELISAKFKLQRVHAASSLLTGVTFEACPVCGTPTEALSRSTDMCYLCGSTQAQQTGADHAPSTLQQDLDSRIDDLNASLQQHRGQLKRQSRIVDRITMEKESLDGRLSEELEAYDSAFLSQSREAERAVATLEEKIRGLQRIARMSQSLDSLDQQIDNLQRREKELRKAIAAERSSLTNAEELVEKLEHMYLQTLLDVGVPGVKPGDEVEISLTTWMPSIHPGGNADLAYDFYSAGSGGKKTLLNVCYALAVHQLVSTASLPLPRFLIIDSPMKNIGKDVNREVFLSLYRKLYELAAGPLQDTQFIIIDDEYASTDLAIEVRSRYMTPADPANPPLIPYYRGA